MDAPTSQPDRIGTWIGALSAIAAVAVAILAWNAVEFAELSSTYAAFEAEVPMLSKVVTHGVYLRAAPIALLSLVVAANLLLPRSKSRLVGLVLIALLGISMVVVGRYGAVQPFVELSSGITDER